MLSLYVWCVLIGIILKVREKETRCQAISLFSTFEHNSIDCLFCVCVDIFNKKHLYIYLSVYVSV